MNSKSLQTIPAVAPSPVYSRASQMLSLYSALLLSGLVLLFPQVLIDEQGSADHGFLSLMMYGISAGFVFGVGFVPRHRVLVWLLGPWVCWPLMLYSMAWIIFTL